MSEPCKHFSFNHVYKVWAEVAILKFALGKNLTFCEHLFAGIGEKNKLALLNTEVCFSSKDLAVMLIALHGLFKFVFVNSYFGVFCVGSKRPSGLGNRCCSLYSCFNRNEIFLAQIRQSRGPQTFLELSPINKLSCWQGYSLNLFPLRLCKNKDLLH